MFLLRLTSVRLPTAATVTTDITHTLARLTAITVPNTSMAAFLSEWVRGSTVSTVATGPAIVISAATMTDSVIVTGSAISVASAIFMVGVTSMAEDSAAMVISMAAASAAGISSMVAEDSAAM